MRKLLLITFITLFTTSLSAQNIILSESFDGSSMPDGWSTSGDGAANWSITETNFCGGSKNEISLANHPFFEGVSRLVFPAVDLTDYSSVVFQFRHCFTGINYSSITHSLGVATSSDNGITWHNAWVNSYNTNDVYTFSRIITTEDFGKPNVRFCIYYQGNTHTLVDWNFDNILVFTEEGGFGFGYPETFDSLTMPNGWLTLGEGEDNWSISATSNAGGSANEIKLFCNPNFNGISRLISPPVNLIGVSRLVFEFKHCLNNGRGPNIIGIATSSNSGITWHQAWSQVYITNGQYSVSQTITTEDFGKPYVRFCIFYEGNSGDMNSWYFDDIALNEYHVGLAEQEANTCKIFPNPANGSVNVVANDNIRTVYVYNVLGVLVEAITANNDFLQISTENYQCGVYFVNMVDAKGVSHTTKMVVRH